jgi:hypothetical protein
MEIQKELLIKILKNPFMGFLGSEGGMRNGMSNVWETNV